MKGTSLYLFFALLCIIFPLTLTLGNSLLITYTPSTYQKLMTQNDIISLSKSDRKNLAVSIYHGLIQQKSVQTVLESGKNAFSEKEIIHMMDVAALIKLLTFLFLFLSLTSILLFLNVGRKYFQLVMVQPIVSILISILILVLVLLNFEQMFTLFHQLTFRNDFWLLDPEKDLLINLFPQSFFMIQFAKINVMTLLELILLFFGLRVLKK